MVTVVVNEDLGEELDGPADCAEGAECIGCGRDIHGCRKVKPPFLAILIVYRELP